MTFKTDTTKIKLWREQRHWSQEHLADLAGVSLRTLQRIESGETASQESIKALAAAFDVDVMALSIDPEVEAANIVRTKNERTRSGTRLAFFIHLAGFVCGLVVFLGISLGSGYFVMMWPTIWLVVGIICHGAVVGIIEVVTRHQDKFE